MAIAISFSSLTLASKDRLTLGPPDFPRLKYIHIGELRAYWPETMPESASADLKLLSAMNPNVEQLDIGVLTILRGGLDIKDVELIKVGTAYTDGGVRLQVGKVGHLEVDKRFNKSDDEEEDDDGAVTVRSRGSIKVKRATIMEVEELVTGVGAPVMREVQLILPAALDPDLKWAPVQVAKKPFRSGG